MLNKSFIHPFILAAFVTFGISACSSPNVQTKSDSKPTEATQSQAKQTVDANFRFKTQPAMYAANEEWLTFACELPDGQVPIGAENSMEMYYYSMYGLGNLLFRSGMGVHLVHNPLFKKHVENDKGMPWYQKKNGSKLFMKHKMKQFVERTAAYKASSKFPPKNTHPIFLEYASGVPAFTQKPKMDNFKTLRWDKASFDRTLSPGAWGQSMMKQVLWARDFFTHPKEIDGVTYLGNSKDDGGNGFRGAALIAQAITKSFALKSTLAYDAQSDKLGGVDPANYSPKNGPVYYPSAYKADFVEGTKPPKPKGFEVTDKTSDLFDVSSLLWAQSEFYFFTDPTIDDAYDKLFGDPKWNPSADRDKLRKLFKKGKTIFPKKPHKLSKGITAVNVKNLKGLHFNEKHGTLVDSWHPKTKQGDKISLPYAAMAIVALANTHHHLHDVPKLKGAAKKMLTAQAKFLLRQQNDDGSFATGYRLGDDVAALGGEKRLLAQTSGIRGLLAAYHATDNKEFWNAAETTYQYMEQNLRSEKANIYRAEVGADKSTYNGLNFGSTIGALRELAIARQEAGQDNQQVVARLDRFFEEVAQKGGLQLAEIGRTGETIPSPQKRKKLKAKLMKLKKQNPRKAKMMKQKMMDSDQDSVPKPIFVKGTKYGAAPVQRASVTLPTP